MSLTLRTITLGCKVNQYETEYVREGLKSAGYRDANENSPADLCIVNSCTVTNEGDAKSRQAIRRLARENPDARIVVMGCYATRAPEEVAQLPGVSEIVTDKRELPDLLGRFGVIDIPTGISTFGDRQRAFIKVQDGCMLRCSYCIIPYVRPDLTSRPMQHIVDEAQRLINNGYRELVLTGIHLGHYGIEWNWGKPKNEWVRLSDLVRQICRLPGEFRVRLSSIEATEVTRELIEVLREFSDRVCPHLHVCLQSGSDEILRQMRRRWSARMFVDRCQLVKEKLDTPSFTTDIIVGFPGESEHDFALTCRVAREVGFSKIHIFPFSPRKGTSAATIADQVEPSLKRERVERLTELERQLRAAYAERLVGRRLKVLVEATEIPSPDNSEIRYLGTSCRYMPVEISSRRNCVGELVDVSITQSTGSRLIAAPGELGD